MKESNEGSFFLCENKAKKENATMKEDNEHNEKILDELEL